MPTRMRPPVAHGCAILRAHRAVEGVLESALIPLPTGVVQYRRETGRSGAKKDETRIDRRTSATGVAVTALASRLALAPFRRLGHGMAPAANAVQTPSEYRRSHWAQGTVPGSLKSPPVRDGQFVGAS